MLKYFAKIQFQVRNYFLVLCLIPALLTSCSGSVISRAYKTTSVIATTADAGMRFYGEFYRAKLITPEVAIKVKAAYEQYQEAMEYALNAIQVAILAKETYQDTKDGNVMEAITALNQAIKVLQDILNMATSGSHVKLKSFSAANNLSGNLNNLDAKKLGMIRKAITSNPLKSKSMGASMAPNTSL